MHSKADTPEEVRTHDAQRQGTKLSHELGIVVLLQKFEHVRVVDERVIPAGIKV
jgi:hypothetical protein